MELENITAEVRIRKKPTIYLPGEGEGEGERERERERERGRVGGGLSQTSVVVIATYSPYMYFIHMCPHWRTALQSIG